MQRTQSTHALHHAPAAHHQHVAYHPRPRADVAPEAPVAATATPARAPMHVMGAGPRPSRALTALATAAILAALGVAAVDTFGALAAPGGEGARRPIPMLD